MKGFIDLLYWLQTNPLTSIMFAIYTLALAQVCFIRKPSENNSNNYNYHMYKGDDDHY